MNIVIVSKDSYFISGLIHLINEAWSPLSSDSPVFLVADVNKSWLVPDIVITDVCKTGTRVGYWNSARPEAAKEEQDERYVSLFMAAQCHAESGFCLEHLIQVTKAECRDRIVKLFRSPQLIELTRKAPVSPQLFPRLGHIVLSKQQAMVVKYTRLGLSLTDISRVTSLSIKTISTHKRAVMRKLDIKNNSDFYRYALAKCTPH